MKNTGKKYDKTEYGANPEKLKELLGENWGKKVTDSLSDFSSGCYASRDYYDKGHKDHTNAVTRQILFGSAVKGILYYLIKNNSTTSINNLFSDCLTFDKKKTEGQDIAVINEEINVDIEKEKIRKFILSLEGFDSIPHYWLQQCEFESSSTGIPWKIEPILGKIENIETSKFKDLVSELFSDSSETEANWTEQIDNGILTCSCVEEILNTQLRRGLPMRSDFLSYLKITHPAENDFFTSFKKLVGIRSISNKEEALITLGRSGKNQWKLIKTEDQIIKFDHKSVEYQEEGGKTPYEIAQYIIDSYLENVENRFFIPKEKLSTELLKTCLEHNKILASQIPLLFYYYLFPKSMPENEVAAIRVNSANKLLSVIRNRTPIPKIVPYLLCKYYQKFELIDYEISTKIILVEKSIPEIQNLSFLELLSQAKDKFPEFREITIPKKWSVWTHILRSLKKLYFNWKLTDQDYCLRIGVKLQVNSIKYYQPLRFRSTGFDKSEHQNLVEYLWNEVSQKTSGRKYFLVSSGAGQGKTAMLSKLYIKYIRNRHKLPTRAFVFIQVDEQLDDKLVYLKELQNHLILKNIHIVLLLDGLDEDPKIYEGGKNVQQNVKNRLEQIKSYLGGLYCVIATYRFQIFSSFENEREILENVFREGQDSRFSRTNESPEFIYIKKFNSKQVNTYLKIRFKEKTRRVRVKKLLDQYCSDYKEPLMSHQLLLANIEYLVDNKSSSEFRYKYEIYTAITNNWSEIEAKKSACKLQISEWRFKRNLQSFALELAKLSYTASKKKDNLDDEQKRQITLKLEKLYDGNESILKLLSRGALVTRDRTGNWQFTHRTFLDFFVAKAAFGYPNIDKLDIDEADLKFDQDFEYSSAFLRANRLDGKSKIIHYDGPETFYLELFYEKIIGEYKKRGLSNSTINYEMGIPGKYNVRGKNRNLSKLQLEEIPFVTKLFGLNEDIRNHIHVIRCFKALEAISHLPDYLLANVPINIIGNLRNLAELSIHAIENEVNMNLIFSYFCQFEQLKKLEVTDCRLTNFQDLKNLKNLECFILKLRGGYYPSFHLKGVFENLPKLKILSVNTFSFEDISFLHNKEDLVEVEFNGAKIKGTINPQVFNNLINIKKIILFYPSYSLIEALSQAVDLTRNNAELIIKYKEISPEILWLMRPLVSLFIFRRLFFYNIVLDGQELVNSLLYNRVLALETQINGITELSFTSIFNLKTIFHLGSFISFIKIGTTRLKFPNRLDEWAILIGGSPFPETLETCALYGFYSVKLYKGAVINGFERLKLAKNLTVEALKDIPKEITKTNITSITLERCKEKELDLTLFAEQVHSGIHNIYIEYFDGVIRNPQSLELHLFSYKFKLYKVAHIDLSDLKNNLKIVWLDIVSVNSVVSLNEIKHIFPPKTVRASAEIPLPALGLIDIGLKSEDLLDLGSCYLKYLSLRNNNIESIKHLKLKHNTYEIRPTSAPGHSPYVFKAESIIKVIDLSKNSKLVDISKLFSISSLEEIIADSCLINSIPPNSGIENLTKLSISGNPLNNIANLVQYSTLRELNIKSSEPILDYTSLSSLVNLRSLSITLSEENAIEIIEIISNLPALQELHLEVKNIGEFQRMPYHKIFNLIKSIYTKDTGQNLNIFELKNYLAQEN